MQDHLISTKVAALTAEHEVPSNVVLAPMSSGFTLRFEETGAIWFCAEAALLLDIDNEDTSPEWLARCGGRSAVPAKPNTGNSKCSSHLGISCLGFVEQLNCGYTVPKAIDSAGSFSLAVIYAPSSLIEPRTLLTVNPLGHENYVFLSERDNAIVLTDDQGSFVLRCPLKTECDGFRLVVFSRNAEGEFSLCVDMQEIKTDQTQVLPSKNEDRSDLFIGCRSHRAGILKTLGKFVLADVVLWPGKDILASQTKTPGSRTGSEYDVLMSYFKEVISHEL